MTFHDGSGILQAHDRSGLCWWLLVCNPL